MGNDRVDKAMILLLKPSRISLLILFALMAGAFTGIAHADTPDPAVRAAGGPSRASGTPQAAPMPEVPTSPPAGSPAASSGQPRPELPPPPHPTPEQRLADLTLEQRVGQLFMVAAKADGSDAGTVADLLNNHVGNIYLAGRSQAGVAGTASVVARLRAAISPASSSGLPLSVGTDQEGGAVQVLNGPGFSPLPAALDQGNVNPDQLRADARNWGSELLQAGVNVDLGPVLDTVPGPEFASSNKPIGAFKREYGFTPATVSAHGIAMAAGLRDAGVAPVAKHFPGMGRVSLNTDVSANVHDTETTRTDPYLMPFKAAIDAGLRWVMISNAYYDKIDPDHVAPFSSIIMRTMLRTDAGFTGIIVSDDLCNAVQLSPWSVGDRATNFIGAGGTMVLCADPASVPAMYAHVLQRAQSDPGFRKSVDAAALTVLRVKAGK
ncbi:glycoside hydrolase family 3 N-terminal domain-containing protein [Arthrobacter bambusae]|uniref:glycoside hydrolase family 3 N-terminal domain-containing protein n=1 Tax=Arthrobacter bambusae TaxID=1338426 RepID=UPI00277D9A04|nr:glycoside hydrolase family 3 N-terminal domain-containing protein [Arthrobacter bambusae]MDQ0030269.1 beta-N-acetylhexosaminidase [Arthrobacter bambusae]MDQ0097951.1 beta-N-acetylhexosaminidase [Arthrobacter bambusae]